jgi:hypothetical protein
MMHFMAKLSTTRVKQIGWVESSRNHELSCFVYNHVLQGALHGVPELWCLLVISRTSPFLYCSISISWEWLPCSVCTPVLFYWGYLRFWFSCIHTFSLVFSNRSILCPGSGILLLWFKRCYWGVFWRVACPLWVCCNLLDSWFCLRLLWVIFSIIHLCLIYNCKWNCIMWHCFFCCLVQWNYCLMHSPTPLASHPNLEISFGLMLYSTISFPSPYPAPLELVEGFGVVPLPCLEQCRLLPSLVEVFRCLPPLALVCPGE